MWRSRAGRLSILAVLAWWAAACGGGETGAASAVDAPRAADATLPEVSNPALPDPLPTLTLALTDPNPGVRSDAAYRVAESAPLLGAEAAAERLSGMMLDPDAAVRDAAVFALVELGGPEAVEALAVPLQNPDPRVRQDAVLALTELESHASRALLHHALDDPDPDVRETARDALQDLNRTR